MDSDFLLVAAQIRYLVLILPTLACHGDGIQRTNSRRKSNRDCQGSHHSSHDARSYPARYTGIYRFQPAAQSVTWQSLPARSVASFVGQQGQHLRDGPLDTR